MSEQDEHPAVVVQAVAATASGAVRPEDQDILTESPAEPGDEG